MKIRSILLLLLLALPLGAAAQPGMFSLGMRTPVSVFTGHSGFSPGMGTGGQFRIQFARQVNTEFYADYISSSLGEVAGRKDYHIGWSVIFYPFQGLSTPDHLLQPFAEAGHCFDYSNVFALQDTLSGRRWSSAVQMGIGTHLNFTERFDLSVKTQYMIHLGSDLHAHAHGTELEITNEKGSALEGHLLFTLSFNYKLFRLWGSN